jgi:tetratricopeptide (TPR) repeat protein
MAMISSLRQDSQQTNPLEDPLLASALLGAGLPMEAEELLQKASAFYHLDDVAEKHLLEAHSIAPGHAAVLIGLYRFYFYKGRLADALEIARVCLLKAAADCELSADWRLVSAHDANFSDYEETLPRFYLFTLKAYAYLQMRLGNLEEGLVAVLKLLELDPSDKIGAKVLLEVLQRMGRDDHD